MEREIKLIETRRLGRVRYSEGLRFQEECRDMILRGEAAKGFLLLLEHYPVITNGRFAEDNNFVLPVSLIEQRGIEVYRTDRGGDLTYHGPGQLVAYPILSLREFKLGARAYIHSLEEVLIKTLHAYGIDAHSDPGYPGVWVKGKGEGTRAKIASIGVSVKNGVTSHGCALNVSTDLSYFSLIVPCGIPEVNITSMENVLGEKVDIDSIADTFSRLFAQVFGAQAAPSGLGQESCALPA